MITPIAIYDIQTGEIKSTGGIQFDVDLKAAQIFAALTPWGGSEVCSLYEGLEDISAESSYVTILDGIPSITPRPPLRVSQNKTEVVANGTDSITLRGLPDPCEMVQDPGEPEESRVTVEGGGFVFTAETPGVYRFRIERFPFVPLDLEFTAT
jgi:hypothetical protein